MGAERNNLVIWIAVAAIVTAGLVLRVLAAQGGLWLDEAWSAKLAHDVGTPLGVFLNINHDNSHHLNTLWLQSIGLGAPSWLARLPAIVTGSIAIVVAAAIARPAGAAATIVTAMLFAFSPILVTLESEARGYAPMTLAFLVAILLTDRWLRDRATYSPQTALALCFFLGIFSQMTMLFGIVALGGWVFFTIWKEEGARGATIGSLRLFGPAIIATLVALGIVAAAAAGDPRGFQFGRYEPFGLLLYLHGVTEMIGFTIGFPVVTLWLIPMTVALVILARSAQVQKIAFYRLAIIAFPLMLAILQSGNVGHPRYYLIAGIALLLLLGQMIAAGLHGGRLARIAAIVGLGAFLVASSWQNLDLVRNQRGDPGFAVIEMQQRAPQGAAVILDRDTALAMVETAAAQRGYHVKIITRGCAPARFALADRFKGESFPRVLLKCGIQYHPVARRYAHGLSGTHWTLYEHAKQ